MGCTRDVINVTLKNKSYLKNFTEAFDEILRDYLYDKDYQIHEISTYNVKENNECFIYIEEEPLFKIDENGAQIDLFVKKYLEKYPEVDFKLSYNLEELNCDGAMYVEYLYDSENKKLIIERKYAEAASISYCPECDEYLEETLVYLDEYDPNETYTCPECGAELELEVEISKKEIKIGSKEWEDFA